MNLRKKMALDLELRAGDRVAAAALVRLAAERGAKLTEHEADRIVRDAIVEELIGKAMLHGRNAFYMRLVEYMQHLDVVKQGDPNKSCTGEQLPCE